MSSIPRTIPIPPTRESKVSSLYLKKSHPSFAPCSACAACPQVERKTDYTAITDRANQRVLPLQTARYTQPSPHELWSSPHHTTHTRQLPRRQRILGLGCPLLTTFIVTTRSNNIQAFLLNNPERDTDSVCVCVYVRV